MSRNDKILRSLNALSSKFLFGAETVISPADFAAYFNEYPEILAAALYSKNIVKESVSQITAFGFDESTLAEIQQLLSHRRYNRYNNDGHASGQFKFLKQHSGQFPLLSKYPFRLTILVLRKNTAERAVLILKTRKNDRLNKSELTYFTFLAKQLTGNSNTEKNGNHSGFDFFPDPVLMLDTGGNKLKLDYCNPATKAFSVKSGFNTELGLIDLLNSKASLVSGALTELNKTGEAIIPYNFRKPGEREREILFHFNRVAGSKQILCRISDNTPNNDLKRSYDLTLSRVAALIENIQSGILLEDESRNIVVTNPEFCRISGVAGSAEDLIGANCAELMHGYKSIFERPDEFTALTDDLISGGAVSAGHEFRLKDGRFIVLDYIPVVVGDNYAGHLWNYKDATKAKQDLDELSLAKHTAEESIKSKELFLAHMSHEIRTPMHAITGLVTLLLQTGLNPKQLQYLTAIKNSSDNLLVIINDILDFSKINAGKVELDYADFPINTALDQVLQIMLPTAEGKKLKLEIKKTADVPAVIIGDKVRLVQILLNLISNAVKFTDRGSVLLSVSAVQTTEENALLRFEVSDTGIGMDADQLEYIFDSFSQIYVPQPAKRTGTGLGLGITRSLVELHGGKISVRSKAGKGSVFTVEINYRVSKLSPDSFEEKHELFEKKALEGKRALVAEDDIFNQLVITNFLDSWGAGYDAAYNGKTCVELAAANNYDFILMDLGMPDMDGYEAAEKIRSLEGNKFRDIPIIALTASVEKEIKQKILASGMSDYIAKPVKPGDLINKILANLPDKPGYRAAALSGDSENSTDQAGYFSKESFYEFVGKESDFIVEVLEKFLSQTDENLASLNSALDENKIELIQLILHRIKSSFGYMGIRSIYNEMDEMEKLCGENCDYGRLMSGFRKCDEIWRSVKKEIEAELEHHKRMLL